VQADSHTIENFLGAQRMTLFATLKPIGMAVLNTLLPPNCLACDAPVDADGEFRLGTFLRAMRGAAALRGGRRAGWKVR
jgi:hypothetical protein